MVELIPKQEKKPIFGQLFFFIVAVAVFAGVLVGVVVVRQLESDTREALDLLEKTLVSDVQPQEEELEKILLEYERQAEDLKEILKERKEFLAFFAFLEETTHPDIFFVDLQGGLSNSRVMLSGVAADFFILEQQRIVWREREELLSLKLQELEITESGGAFEVEFLFVPDFLNRAPLRSFAE